MIGMRTKRGMLAALLLIGVLAAAVAAEVWEQTTWRRITYYRSSFAAAVAGTAQLHVAAVDSYQVYLNGMLVGADSTAARMRAYTVRVTAGQNQLAVRVVNRGQGAGSGLLLLLETDSLRVTSTTDQSAQVWRWTQSEQTGTDWRTVPPPTGWQAVQNGTMDTTRIAGLVSPVPEIIAGYEGGTDIGGVGGGLRLKHILGENLALGKPANRVETVDGDLLTAWEPPVAALNFTASVDLLDRFLVRRVRVLTRGPGYVDASLRGYSVQVSDDQVRWSEVASLHDIADPVRTTADFAPTWTRYVRIVVVQINAVTQPRVAELEVYADGFADRGTYISPPIALAGGRVTNPGRVDWQATTPARTGVTVQFRTGDSAAELAAADTAAADSGWSAPLEHGPVWFPGVEPARLLQYRVNLETRDERRTPVFHGLRVEHTPDDIPVTAASAWVAPTSVPMGVDTTFRYHVRLDFGSGDRGVERLQIEVPAAAELALDAASPADVLPARWESSQDTLTLWFAPPLARDVELTIPLRTRTYSNLHAFRGYVYSPGADNPSNVTADVSLDPLTAVARTWEVLATTAYARSLRQVRAHPPVFTPNGDGVNDDTVVEFVLAKVETPRRVRLHIMDLAGRMVADLRPPALASGAYLSGSSAAGRRSAPGRWDGRDQEGNLVPPGIYVYQVEVHLDSGREVQMGTVAVAY